MLSLPVVAAAPAPRARSSLTPMAGLASSSSACIETASEYAAAFANRTNSSALLDTACVHRRLNGQVHFAPLTPQSYLREQNGRNITFGLSAETLEKILVYGSSGAEQITGMLGLGELNQEVYYLLVWELSLIHI